MGYLLNLNIFSEKTVFCVHDLKYIHSKPWMCAGIDFLKFIKLLAEHENWQKRNSWICVMLIESFYFLKNKLVNLKLFLCFFYFLFKIPLSYSSVPTTAFLCLFWAECMCARCNMILSMQSIEGTQAELEMKRYVRIMFFKQIRIVSTKMEQLLFFFLFFLLPLQNFF